ncbi:MAG: phosphotransferase family protein [Methylobacteriaceae bacterium]|nr:phosphotransferase family protein [Methylobacteriaceae bacterium]
MSEAGGATAADHFAGTKPVEERHRFDEARLDEWMRGNVGGYSGPLTVSQFKGGQSNPTYRLDTPDVSYVLRRKPFGKLLPSAHAVDREYRVITALHATGFPVARTYGLCTDDSVIGAAFYIMSMVEGRIFWDGTLPGIEPGERRAIYESEIRTLARLHQYDPEKIGLSDYGKSGNYFARQIDRWTKQYRASETQTIEPMNRLIEWLPKTVPTQERVSVVHGDYRIDNMIFHGDRPQVAAVLDWELSTLGDPLADFTYVLMNWSMPHEGRSSLGGVDVASLGIPTQADVVAIYCKETGRGGIPDLDWYFAYNLFRLCGIVQGIAGRVRDGTAASARAVEQAARAVPLAEAAWRHAVRAGA